MAPPGDVGVTDDLVFERRRYGAATFTWVYLVVEGVRHLVGDPWPSVIVPRDELARDVAAIRARLACRHNTMVRRADPARPWRCAHCGYVYGQPAL
jgi:hypothetical protein